MIKWLLVAVIIFLFYCPRVPGLNVNMNSGGLVFEKKPRLAKSEPAKPRLLVLTDIGGDPDDQQSMVRLMVYSNEFDLEGLIASASGTPGELKEAVTKPELIEEIVRAYGQVRNNLLQHQSGYPSVESLLSVIKQGNPQRGASYVGEGHNTEGSDWIIRVVDRSDDRPVNIAIWGGQTDLAQALWQVKNTRSEEQYRQFVRRIRVHDIADQDGIHSWMMEQFPGLFYILNKAAPEADKRDGVFRGMYLGGDESFTSAEWIQTHVKENHGPLGALYPMKTWTAPNPHGVLKEGDTPSWFYFLSSGLSDPAQPGYGGWGGRFRKGESGWYTDARDQVGEDVSARATVWRWRPHYQNDLQARLDWCVKSYEEANHPPQAAFRDEPGQEVIYLTATPGEEVRLSARGSTDPDGDSLSYRWERYPEAGTFRGELALEDATSPEARFTIPDISGMPNVDTATGDTATIHIILTVTDNGEPNLYGYRRVVVSVRPPE